MKIRNLFTRSSRRSLAAFSLTEVTISMGVVGTVVGALFTGMTSGLFNIRMARENLRATQIMLEKVETIRLYSWSQINTPGFIPTTFTATYDPQGATNNAQGLTYSGTMTINTNPPISSSYSNDMAAVTVTLNWQTGNLQRNRQFTTYVTRNGLQSYIY